MDTERPGLRISGTTAVVVVTPRGERYSIRDIGIGHPMHTIGPKGGRCSTDAEIALFEALMLDDALKRDREANHGR